MAQSPDEAMSDEGDVNFQRSRMRSYRGQTPSKSNPTMGGKRDIFPTRSMVWGDRNNLLGVEMRFGARSRQEREDVGSGSLSTAPTQRVQELNSDSAGIWRANFDVDANR